MDRAIKDFSQEGGSIISSWKTRRVIIKGGRRKLQTFSFQNSVEIKVALDGKHTIHSLMKTMERPMLRMAP